MVCFSKLFFKKIVLLFFTAILTFWAAGCGSENQKEKINLKFWHSIESPHNNQLLRQKIDEFEAANPGIKIVTDNIGAQDKAMPKIMNAMAAGRQPELLWMAPIYTGQMATSGKQLKSEIFFDDPEFNSSNTWEEFRKSSIKLTQKDNNRYGFLIPMGTREWTVWTWQTFLWQAGGGLRTESKRPVFGQPPGVKALQSWMDLKTKHEAAVFSAADTGYKTGMFLAGRVSIMINELWNVSVLKNQDRVDYGSFFLPDYKKRSTNIGGENLYIFKSNPEQEKAAWEFAKYIMSEDFQIDWSGYIPVNRKAAESTEYVKYLEENPFMETFVKLMKFGKSRPPVPEYSRISIIIGQGIERALYLTQSPGEALREANKKVEDLLTDGT